MDIFSQWGRSTIYLHEKECEMCAKIAHKKLSLEHFFRTKAVIDIENYMKSVP